MATARFAWGIDVGNRALKAVKLVRDGDAFRIDDFEVIEHETVLSNAGDNKETLIQTALASFVQRHQIKGGVVGVGVSGQSSFARFIKLPPVEPKKIPEIVRFEAIQQIPFPLDDVEWSYQLFQNPESPDVEVGIFAMRKELVNQHIRYFTDIDLNVQVVQMNPLAVYNALQHDGKFDGGTTMVIDLGAENTDLLIADNETIWMRSIPIGGNNFTETLVKAFKLNFAKAEDLKRNSATSKYARQIFQAMRPIFADLVAEIQRSIGFYSSVHRDSRIKKVLALGGTFKLPGLQKYLQQNLQMDVERLDSISASPPTDPKLVPTFNENLLSVVSAYGLALQAMSDTKINSSLLPAAIRRTKEWQEKTKWFAAAAALFVAGTTLAAGKCVFDNFQFEAGQKANVTEINKVKSAAVSLDKQWAEIENAGSEERTKTAEIGKLDSYRAMWRNMLVDLYGAIPPAPKELMAAGPIDVKKLPPRNQRKLIAVDSVVSHYVENLSPLITSGTFGPTLGGTQASNAPLDAAAPAAPPPAPPLDSPEMQNASIAQPSAHGYLVTFNCTSPNAAAIDPQGLVDKEFISRLLKIKPDASRAKMEYAVARAATVNVRKIRGDQGKLQELRNRYDAIQRAKDAGKPQPAMGESGGMQPPNGFGTGNPNYPGGPGAMGASGAAGAGTTANDAEAFKDPLTGEDVREDWEFQVVVAVVIDPQPFAGVPGGAPGGAAAPGPQANAR